MNVLIVSAHLDDEVLGCGGAIAYHADKGDNVYVCFVTEGVSGQYEDKKMLDLRRKNARQAGEILGVKEFFFFNLPDVKLDTIPQLEVNKIIEGVVEKVNPKVVYTHYDKDLNDDHVRVHQSTLVACRPSKAKSVKKVLLYEIFGSTREFIPDYYIDISKYFHKKLKALASYESEVSAQTRSLKTTKKVAAFRGAEVNLEVAEAFKLYREVIS